MLRPLLALDARLHARIESSMERRGVLYPWWVPTVCVVGQLICVAIALLQRDALVPPEPIVAVVLLVVISPVVHLLLGGWLPWWLDGVGTLAAAVILMATPVTSGIDLAPALLAFLSAEAVARDGFRTGGIVAVVSAATIVVMAATTGVEDHVFYLLEVALGAVVGAMLWWQMRALVAEREARASAWSQATAAERDRIAREIHDLVAHSLSVTLLQVTGARHTLREVAEAESATEAAQAIADVDAALDDAEQVGRRAMTDIRATVSALAQGPSERTALPGARDIAPLVEEFGAAGLAVEYDERGDLSHLSAADGLGLYRIAQECLANIAKHAPSGPEAAGVLRLTASRHGARLEVRNRRPDGRVRTDGLGSGLAGMQARAAQLGATLEAGPVGGVGGVGGEWVVDVRLGAQRQGEPKGVELPCGRTVRRPSGAPAVEG